MKVTTFVGILLCLLVFPRLACANAPPTGALEHVSRSWIEGWAADPDDFSQPLPIEVYATATSGDGTTRWKAGKRLGRIASGLADLPRDTAHGFRFSVLPKDVEGKPDWTRAFLLDGRDHTVWIFAKDLPSGKLVQVGESFSFRASVLYSQEPITNLDDHLLINTPPTYLGFPKSTFDYGINAPDHLLFVYTPPSPWKLEPSTCQLEAATGIALDAPGQQQLRLGAAMPDGTAGRYVDEAGEEHCNAAQVAGPWAGVLWDSKAFGIPNTGVMLQVPWAVAPRPWRQGEPNDKLRVQGYFRQPRVFPDAPTHPANVTFWYFVLLLHDCRGGADIWWCGRVFQSHLISYNPDRDPPKTEGWQYGMAFPDENRTVLSPEMLLVETPVQPQPAGQDWLSLVSGSASRTMEAFPEERLYGFDVSGAQLQRTLLQLDAEREAFNQRHPDTPIAPVATDPADFQVSFVLIDIEGWGISDEARIGLSMRGLTIEELHAPASPATGEGQD